MNQKRRDQQSLANSSTAPEKQAPPVQKYRQVSKHSFNTFAEAAAAAAAVPVTETNRVRVRRRLADDTFDCIVYTLIAAAQ